MVDRNEKKSKMFNDLTINLLMNGGADMESADQKLELLSRQLHRAHRAAVGAELARRGGAGNSRKCNSTIQFANQHIRKVPPLVKKP